MLFCLSRLNPDKGNFVRLQRFQSEVILSREKWEDRVDQNVLFRSGASVKLLHQWIVNKIAGQYWLFLSLLGII